MSYPIRLFEPGAVHFITNRCMQSRLLMRPSAEINRIVGGVLARATCIFPVELFGFTFESNHFHMLARMLDGACLSDFVAYVEANIARRVGNAVGWSGRFWHRRFSAEPVLDDDALVGRLLYMALHGPKEGLTDKATEWPGLTSLPELCFGVVREFEWCDDAGFHEAERRGGHPRRADFVTRYPLKVAVLPCWQQFGDSQRQRQVCTMIRDEEDQLRLARGGKPVFGVENILAQDPLSKPEHTKMSPRPLCHASSAEARVAFRKLYRAFAAAYLEASMAFRKGCVYVEFPLHCFRPPLPWGWRFDSSGAAFAAT